MSGPPPAGAADLTRADELNLDADDRADEEADYPTDYPDDGGLDGQSWGVFGLFACCLLAAMLSVVPALAAVSCLLSLAVFAMMVSAGARPLPFIWVVVAMYAYWMVSGLISGGLVPSDLTGIDYYQGDGRAFIYYLPLFGFAVLGARPAIVTPCYRFLAAAVVLALPMAILALAQPGDKLDTLTTSSHHGPGALFGAISLMFLARGVMAGSAMGWVMGVVALAPVLSASSRTALVGWVAGLAFLLLANSRPRLVVGCIAAVAALFAMIPFVAPETHERITKLFYAGVVEDMADQYDYSDWSPGASLQGSMVRDEHWNLMARIMFWKHGIRLTKDSPLIGVGFGRFNDPVSKLRGVPGLAAYSTGRTREISHLTAHNTILQVTAETGLIGLAFVVAVWVAIYRHSWAGLAAAPAGSDLAAFHLGACSLIVFLLASGMLSHAFGSPAFGFPSLAVIGVALSLRFAAESPDHQPAI